MEDIKKELLENSQIYPSEGSQKDHLKETLMELFGDFQKYLSISESTLEGLLDAISGGSLESSSKETLGRIPEEFAARIAEGTLNNHRKIFRLNSGEH